MAFSPFLGGIRVCLGKTFAEKISIFTVSLLLFHCEFKLPEDYVKPKINIQGEHHPEIKTRKSERIH
jgi:cytochrome P450